MLSEQQPNYAAIDQLVTQNPGLKMAVKDDSILVAWFNPKRVRGVDMAFVRLEENSHFPECPIVAIKYTPYRGVDQDGGFSDEALGRTLVSIRPVNDRESTSDVTDSFHQLHGPSILERVLYGLEFANKALLMGALNEYDEFEDRREDLPVDRPVLRISDPLKEIGYMINKLEPYRGMLIAS